jgi:hypothetical protein
MIKTVSNASVWVNGAVQIGTCSEVELPEIKQLLIEHEGLGVIGTVETFVGIEAMEATFTWTSFDAASYKAIANPTQPVQLQTRASQKTSGLLGDIEVPVVVFLSGIFKTVPLGKLKKGETIELSSEMAVSYVRLLLGGEELLEIDIFSNTYKVAGTDILSQWRTNLGI